MSNDQKNLAATLLPTTYLEMAGSVNASNQNVGDGADALTLNQNLLAGKKQNYFISTYLYIHIHILLDNCKCVALQYLF